MLYFLTRRTDHDPFIYKSTKINVTSDLSLISKILEPSIVGYDSEANGKRFFTTELLLIQIGTEQDQLVIDFTEPDHLIGWRKEVVAAINAAIREDHIFIGHNLKYDKGVGIPFNLFKPFNLPLFFDTLISEQRINLGTGLLNNLKDTYERRLKKFFPEDKAVRKDFLYMTKYSRMFVKHIMYAGGDIADIIKIAVEQRRLLQETKQYNFVRNVEFPLIQVLCEMEMEGLSLNDQKWLSLINTKKKRRLECQIECDEIIKQLGKGNMYLTGGKFAKPRKKVVVVQPDLFGGESVETENKNTHNINYNSPDAVIDIIEKLGLPKPVFKEKGEEKNSLREESIHTYLMQYPNTPLKSFFEKLLEYKGLQKFISSYGEKFLKEYVIKGGKRELGFKNPVTGKVHTQLKQCFTSTGRLASGEDKGTKSKKKGKTEPENAKLGVFNIQNLPAESEVRECFELTKAEIDAGYWFTTRDLSGAELIIMAALADDQHLYELGADKIINGVKVEGDLHSPISTKCWRAVYEYRKAKLASLIEAKTVVDTKDWFTIKDSKGKSYTLTADFEVSKSVNKPLRTDFKSYTFGVFYGMMAKKGGETLNIPKDEAQVMIDVITKEFPKTMAMLDRASVQAFRYGYVVFNNRSYNRRNFKPVQDLLKNINTSKYSDAAIIQYVKDNLTFAQISDINTEARNCIIQGTQADMIKESLVAIRKDPDYEACKAKLLLSVHDENGAKHLGKEFGEKMGLIMEETANKYLSLYSANIRMRSEGKTIHSWTK